MPNKSEKAATGLAGVSQEQRLVGAGCEANCPTTESGMCGKKVRYYVIAHGVIIAVCGGCAARARENGYTVIKYRPNNAISKPREIEPQKKT